MEQTLAKSEKKLEKIKENLLFIYLIIFPLGQLLSFRLNLFSYSFPVHAIDFLVVILGFTTLVDIKTYPKFFKPIVNFIWILAFCYIFSFTIFRSSTLILGGLYLLRIVFYALFTITIFNIVKNNQNKKILLFKSLIVVSLAIAVYGILQYIFYPDIRGLTILGWDDHLYRLVSTFIDPGFTSIFLVLGFLASLLMFLETKEKKFFVFMAIFMIALTLTYSRAGYLAFFSGTLALLVLKNRLAKLIPLALIFVGILFLIPNYGSEGVRLGRTRSILTRIVSYQDAFSIFKKSPLLGVGYNNICIAKQKYLGQRVNFESHSCSGIESSFLLILATTGIVGFTIFIYGLGNLLILPKNFYGPVFTSSMVAVLTHAFFVNSLFYPWVMGYLGILFAVSVKE